MTVAAWSSTILFLAGVHWNATPAGSGVRQPWPSSMPQGWTTMTAVRSARSRFGTSMMPRAL